MLKRIFSIFLCAALLVSMAVVYTVSAEDTTLTLSGYFTAAQEDGEDDYGFTAYTDSGERITAAQPGDVVVYHLDAKGYQGLSADNYITIIATATTIDTRVFEPFFYYDETAGAFSTDLDVDFYNLPGEIIPSRYAINTTMAYVEREENTALISCFYEWKWDGSATVRKNSAISQDGELCSIFLKVKDDAPVTNAGLHIMTVEDDSRISAVGTCNITDTASNYGQFALTMQTDDPTFSVVKAGTDDITYDVEVAEGALGTVAAPAELTKDGAQFVGWKVISNDGAARVGEEMDCVPAAGTLIQAGIDYAGGTEPMLLQAIYIEVQTQEGAGVRWAAAQSERGMRFETYVDTESLQYITAHGTIIAPAANIADAASFTLENAQNIKAVNVIDELYYGASGRYTRYYGAIVDFERYFFKLDATLAQTAEVATLRLAGRGYVTVDYADGTSKNFYSEFDTNKHVRSIDQVAAAALADTAAGYSEKQLQILQILANGKVADGSVYRTDPKDFITEE